MKTITLDQLNSQTEDVLRDIAGGEVFILAHNGRPAAMLEPIQPQAEGSSLREDPFLEIGGRAQPSPIGITPHDQHDKIIYGTP